MTFVMKWKCRDSQRVYLFPMAENTPRKTLPLMFLGLGLLLIFASAYVIYRNAALQSDFPTVPVPVSYAVPQLSLTDVQSAAHSLADYRGQVVLVNLWATWCPPCKEEMPTLQAYYNRHRDQGFTVIAINDGDPTADVLQFVNDYKLSFPVWLDPTYSATEQAFKTLNLPSSYIVDRNGTIRLMWVGGISRRMLDQYVTPIITENQ